MKLLLALLLTLTFTAQAATTGTLLLKGTVAEVLSIEVAPETIAVNLPLDVSQVDTKVAMVNEISNSSTGYKVTISSANLGYLKLTTGSATFPYQLKYGTSTVDLANSSVFTNATVGPANVSKDVTISYTGVPASDMQEGEYADTVTFVIEVN